MREFRGKRYWLVGASEGLGRALAERLSAAGAEVILSARSADRLAEVAATLPGPSMTLPVDVADTASVRRAADAAGQIDGVVFLAGLYWPMAAQGWNADQVETMCDVCCPTHLPTPRRTRHQLEVYTPRTPILWLDLNRLNVVAH